MTRSHVVREPDDERWSWPLRRARRQPSLRRMGLVKRIRSRDRVCKHRDKIIVCSPTWNDNFIRLQRLLWLYFIARLLWFKAEGREMGVKRLGRLDNIITPQLMDDVTIKRIHTHTAHSHTPTKVLWNLKCATGHRGTRENNYGVVIDDEFKTMMMGA